jgi:antitoxin component YwqK of YwqJK toxin-antitoxin module
VLSQEPTNSKGIMIEVNDSIKKKFAENLLPKDIKQVYVTLDSNRRINLNYYSANTIKNCVLQLNDSFYAKQTYHYLNRISTHSEYKKTGQGTMIVNGTFYAFYEDGGIMSRYTYKMGKLDGPYLSYWQNGFLESIGSYKNDEETGVWKFYNQKGTLIKRKVYK